MPSTSPCTLREDPKTGSKGVHSQEAATNNTYNHNFRNQFCGCAGSYDPHQETGTMFQCLGLGTVETGGCGEDWWHPECLIGLPRDWHKTKASQEIIGGGDAAVDEDETPLPPGFPEEEAFWQMICFKCLESNPWLKPYAGTPGFLPAVYRNGGLKNSTPTDSTTKEPQGQSKKRKAEDDEPSQEEPTAKRAKEETLTQEPSKLATIEEAPEAPEPPKQEVETSTEPPKPKHTLLPTSAPVESFSLFVQENFHDKLCRCADCYPNLVPHPQLREEEDTYEPPLSDDGDANGAASTGTGSLLERGEAALSNVDRVRAIEGAMIYNNLRDKVKNFLKPFAESGQAVSAEDVKEYFEKLRGDEQGIRDAAGQAAIGRGEDGTGSDNRREQGGKSSFLPYYLLVSVYGLTFLGC